MKHLVVAGVIFCGLAAAHANESAKSALNGCENTQPTASAQAQQATRGVAQAPGGLVTHRGGQVVHNTGQVIHRGGNVIHNSGQVAHNTPLRTRPAPIYYGAPAMQQPCAQ